MPESLDELNRLVAIEVMGIEPRIVDASALGPQDYASDWTALGSLLKRMRELGWNVDMHDDEGWHVEFSRPGAHPLEEGYRGDAPTLPEAAARAALEAIRAESGVAR